MNIFQRILELFGFKKRVAAPTRQPEPVIEVKEPPIKKSTLQIKKERIENWRSKTYKGKANRMPLAKFLNPDKYF